ncbi:MAG: polysaccharide deacetylase family protein [Coriobacteriia bacterium]|nr:polysaccharide deacetylase family protein [Coriobacteriia bacterium]
MLIPRFAIRQYRYFINRRFGSTVVLLYHRIIDDGQSDPEHLGVSSELFESHLAMIAENFATPSLLEVCGALRTGVPLPRSSVCITFDDGYRDNFEKALPLLEQYHIPATFFVATLPFEKKLFFWDEGVYSEAEAANLYVDEDLLGRAARNHLVTIGAHTHAHQRLSELSPAEARADIQHNVDLLTQVCGYRPDLFSYPFGGPDSYTPEIVNVIRSFGFAGAFTTTFGTVHGRRDPALLMRYCSTAQPADELAAVLRGYFGDSR